MAENNEQKMKVVIAPEALEQMIEELGFEETQSLLDQIKAAVEDGSFFDEVEPVNLDELKESEPELYAKLIASEQSLPDTPTLH